MKNKTLLFVALIAVFIFSSCSKKTFYDNNIPIKKEIWNINSPLHFEFNITDSSLYYDFYINIRNSISFKTQYFYVFLESEFPNGYIGKDTLGFIICDPFGKWTGKGNGRIKDNRFLYKKKIRFPYKGNYKFKISQGMRDDDVEGITDFGITLFYI